MTRAKKTTAQDVNFDDIEVPAGPPLARLGVKKIHPDAKLPTFATPGSACFDIYSLEDGILYPRGDFFGQGRGFRTGLAFDIPEGYVLQVYSRSGMGFTNSVRLGNSVGIIDPDYKGELKVKLQNDSASEYRVNRGDRIAQGRLEYVVPTEIVEVEDVGSSERAAGGMGSTGR